VGRADGADQDADRVTRASRSAPPDRSRSTSGACTGVLRDGQRAGRGSERRIAGFDDASLRIRGAAAVRLQRVGGGYETTAVRGGTCAAATCTIRPWATAGMRRSASSSAARRGSASRSWIRCTATGTGSRRLGRSRWASIRQDLRRADPHGRPQLRPQPVAGHGRRHRRSAIASGDGGQRVPGDHGVERHGQQRRHPGHRDRQPGRRPVLGDQRHRGGGEHHGAVARPAGTADADVSTATRFDFGTSSSPVDPPDFTQVGATNAYDPVLGYGWTTAARRSTAASPTRCCATGTGGPTTRSRSTCRQRATPKIYCERYPGRRLVCAEQHLGVGRRHFPDQHSGLATAAGQFIHRSFPVTSPTAS
jgi:hypothetical protein